VNDVERINEMSDTRFFYQAEKAYESSKIAKSNISSLSSEVQYLRDELLRLYLITESLWELLKNKFGVTDSELKDIIQEIDLRDGKIDGNAIPEPQICPRCQRSVSIRSNQCIFCGFRPEKERIF